MADNNMPPEEPEPSRGRKMMRNPAEWKKNLVKRQRNMGEAYVSRSTGRQVQVRVMGPPCADGWYNKITLPIATLIHREFWAIGNFVLQNAYIQKQVCKKPVKRRRPVQEPNKAGRIINHHRLSSILPRPCCSTHLPDNFLILSCSVILMDYFQSLLDVCFHFLALKGLLFFYPLIILSLLGV